MMIEYIILVAVIAAGVMGIIITKNMFGSNEIHGKLKNRYLEYIDSLEKDNKKLTGKLNKMKQGVSISKDDFDEANPLGSIGALISQFAPMLPKNIQPLLQPIQSSSNTSSSAKSSSVIFSIPSISLSSLLNQSKILSKLDLTILYILTILLKLLCFTPFSPPNPPKSLLFC